MDNLTSSENRQEPQIQFNPQRIFYKVLYLVNPELPNLDDLKYSTRTKLKLDQYEIQIRTNHSRGSREKSYVSIRFKDDDNQWRSFTIGRNLTVEDGRTLVTYRVSEPNINNKEKIRLLEQILNKQKVV